MSYLLCWYKETKFIFAVAFYKCKYKYIYLLFASANFLVDFFIASFIFKFALVISKRNDC